MFPVCTIESSANTKQENQNRTLIIFCYIRVNGMSAILCVREILYTHKIEWDNLSINLSINILVTVKYLFFLIILHGDF